MHIHILGICGTFMGGLAALAREAGHRVTGCDAGVYPPMSDQLRALGIDLVEGYGADQLTFNPDVFVVGNVVSRAHLADGKPKYPLMEAILNAGLPYTSGPQWLAEHVLQGRHVLAVAGTHGKTTTTSMLAWVLEKGGKAPGFLVGGVPLDFGVSARLGDGTAFVIEADEYDTAFFDKRSKFVHYRPRTAILNNLEFDHADIFADLAERLGAREAYTEGRSSGQWLRLMYDKTRHALQCLGFEAPDFDNFWQRGEWPLPQQMDDGGILRAFREDPLGHPLPTPSGKVQISSPTIAGFAYADCPGHPAWPAPRDAPTPSHPPHLAANQP
eukprot:gene43958-58604_t